MIIAGIDEAGYGPLLGPLVVSCCAIETPHPPTDELPCIWTLLKSAVAKKNAGAKGRLLIADSKVVHNLADGDRLLERGVLAFAATCFPPSASILDFITVLGCTDHALAEHVWYATRCPGDTPPLWVDPGDLAIASNQLRSAMAKSKVRLRALRTRVVSEKRFNTMVGSTQNKASALVSITLAHLYYLHDTFGTEGLIVGIDKQGGREHYTQLLLDSFPETQLSVLTETPVISSYRLTDSAGRNSLIHFREKSEQHFLPTALASMLCKYLRQALMAQFNAWWCVKIPALRPTAGYYQDGMRWLADVEPHLPALKINREELVRIR